MTDFKYVGSELDLFSAATNWKKYWSSFVRQFIHGDVLEVGAGIGSNTAYLDQDTDRKSWLCLEPDLALCEQLQRSEQQQPAGQSREVLCGTLANIPATRKFDTIIYIDVLEHIDADAEELSNAAKHLNTGGHLIVLSPAHQNLFTPFDKAIGHFRRYNKQSLRSCTPSSTTLKHLIYLDSVGLCASLANKLLLRQSMPTKEQIQVWDSLMVPVSTKIDKLFGNLVGKTIVGVWIKL